MDHLRVGVIGAGGHAQSHFLMIKEEPEMKLVAVSEINPNRLALAQKEHNPEYGFLDYLEMLDTCDLDVVYVETMPGHLKNIVLECLERGLHTSIEKPVGMSTCEAKQLLAASKLSKGKAIVSVNRRYKPEVLAIKRMILEQGGAVHVAATYNKPLTRLGTPAMEGICPEPIVCDAIHHVDLLRWLSGTELDKASDVTQIHAESQQGHRFGAYSYNAIVMFETGCAGVMMSHYGVGFRVQRVEVHAENFSAYLDLTRIPTYELYFEGEILKEPLDLGMVGGADFNETSHFVTCIREDRIPWSSLEDLVKTMAVCEAISVRFKDKNTRI